MDKLKAMASADTIIGDPIKIDGETTVIPVSKVSYGFASGGSDFPNKEEKRKLFGGGGGAGMTVTPIAFLVCSKGVVKIIPVGGGDCSDKMVSLVPEMLDKIVGFFKKDKTEKNENKDKNEKE